MKKSFLFLLVFFICLFPLRADEQSNILIIHSYSQEYSWTKKQHESFVHFIQENFKAPLEISTEYLDTKRIAFTPQYGANFREYLQMKYAHSSPDLIYVTDDNALNFIRYSEIPLFLNVPVVFSGINDLDLQAQLDVRRYTGVYEIKKIEKNIKLLKNFSPQTKDIYFLGDATETYHAIEQDVKKQEKNFPTMNFHYIHNELFDTVESSLQALPPRSFVLLTTIGGFKTQDGVSQTLQNSIDKLSELNNIIIMSMEDAYIQGKVIGGYATDGKKQGVLAAKKALQILHNVPLENIASSTKEANTYIFSRKALLDVQLYLPDEVSKNAIILHENISFYIRYQDEIQNALFILLILALTFATLIYLISREKKQELIDTQRNLSQLQKKFEKTDTILHNIEKLSQIIYWEYDIKNSKVLVINATEMQLKLAEKATLSYDDFFNELIHPKNYHLLKENIQNAIEHKSNIEMEHNILLYDSSSTAIINSFKYSPSSNGNIKIIGLIKRSALEA
ncbi:MAG: ABC transporter substrate binding protein [Sulfurimonas sp.]|nr:ABC transporter substrate binding protein [Sulfurimonas sp.]